MNLSNDYIEICDINWRIGGVQADLVYDKAGEYLDGVYVMYHFLPHVDMIDQSEASLAFGHWQWVSIRHHRYIDHLMSRLLYGLAMSIGIIELQTTDRFDIRSTK